MKKRWFTGCIPVLMILAVAFMACPNGDNGGNGGNGGNGNFGGAAHITWDRDVDIVVVGAGTAGVVAALSAIDAKSDVKVVLLEATGVVGGSLRAAGGSLNTMVLDLGELDISEAELDNRWTTFRNIVTNARFTELNYGVGMPDRDYALTAARMARELVFNAAGAGNQGHFSRWGITTEPPLYAAYNTAEFATNFNGVAGGIMYTRAVANNAANIELVTYTTGMEIHMEGDTAVGILARKSDGTPFNVKAAKTVIATGGFTRNNDMIAATSSEVVQPGIKELAPYFISIGTQAVYGIGHDMIVQAGGALHPDPYVGSRVNNSYGLAFRPELADMIHPNMARAFRQTHFMQPDTVLPLTSQIVVNGQGNRFRRETNGHFWGADAAHNGNEPGGVQGIFHGASGFATYMIIDAKPPYWVIYCGRNTQIDGMGMDGSGNQFRHVDALQAAADLGPIFVDNQIGGITGVREVVKGTSPQTLAAAMFPGNTSAQANFVATLNAYNAAAGPDAAGNPDPLTTQTGTQWSEAGGSEWNVPLLGKSPEHRPWKIDGGEDSVFYAARIYISTISNFSGAITDLSGRVLTSEGGTPIPNLYAVGEVAARPFFNGFYSGGASLTFKPGMGRIVGLHAAGALNN